MRREGYAYFPGCTQKGTAVECEMSARKVAEALDIQLVELEDWSCCGSTPAHTVDPLLYGALAGRNIAIAEQMGFSQVVTPCPSCLVALKTALQLARNGESLNDLRELVGLPLEGDGQAKSLLQIVYEDVGMEKLGEQIKKPLTGVRLVPYYGCILTRPPQRAQFDDPENPISMDRLLETAGAEVPEFPFKTECCGAAFGLPKRDMVLALSAKILEMAREVGADAVVVACPLCHQNMDLRQDQIGARRGIEKGMPIIYFTQALGLALGFSAKEMGLDKHAVSTGKLLSKWEESFKG